MSVWLALALTLIVAGGFAILRRLHLLGVALGFWLVFAAGIAVLATTEHAMTARWHLGPITGAELWRILVFSPEILVFLFFMITDPKTVPESPPTRRAFGARDRPARRAADRPPDHRVRDEGGGPGGARPGVRGAAADRAGAVGRTDASRGGPHAPAAPLRRASGPGRGHSGQRGCCDGPRLRRGDRGGSERERGWCGHPVERRAAGGPDPALPGSRHAAGPGRGRADRRWRPSGGSASPPARSTVPT